MVKEGFKFALNGSFYIMLYILSLSQSQLIEGINIYASDCIGGLKYKFVLQTFPVLSLTNTSYRFNHRDFEFINCWICPAEATTFETPKVCYFLELIMPKSLYQPTKSYIYIKRCLLTSSIKGLNLREASLGWRA